MVRQSLIANIKSKHDSPGGNDFEGQNKEINSWDRSSTDAEDSTPKTRPQSDWDASSDCHETMVEPFEDKIPNEHSDWDSDVDSPSKPKIGDEGDNDNDINNGSNMSSPKVNRMSKSASSFDSLDLSMLDVNDVDGHNLFDMFNKNENSKIGQAFQALDEKGKENKYSSNEEDSLLVEDIEEFAKEEPTAIFQRLNSSRKASNNSKGTPNDTFVWMIPNSNRTSSTDSFGKSLLTISEKDNLKNLKRFCISLKKTKSSSCVERKYLKRNAVKSSKSEILNHSNSNAGEINNLPMTLEGPHVLPKLGSQFETCKKTDKTTDEPRVYFTEYECRTVMTNSDAPQKTSRTTLSSVGEENDSRGDHREGYNENLSNTEVTEANRNDEGHHNMMLAGPSTQTSLEVVSLPDILARSLPLERQAKDKVTRRINTSGKTRTEVEINVRPNNPNPRNESWFLLDETGQYQEVTKYEVSILLNGRSAEAVLQGHKEHFIQGQKFSNIQNQKGSLNGVITKESIQNILREEDMGGEGQEKKPIDLERKVENTLLYIQPGINLTASIRIIPVDTEMIHIWRRGRDNGSLLSSEVDLRLQASQDSVENPNCRMVNDHHVNYMKRLTREKTQQTVTELDENAVLEVPNAPIMNNKTNVHILDYSKLLIETRTIVDNLTNNLKVLQNRLDGETNRNSALQEEVKKLRKLLNGPEDQSPDDFNEGSKNVHESNSASTLLIAREKQSENVIMAEKMTNDFCAETEKAASLAPSNETQTSKETMNSDKIQPESDYITVNIYTTDENLTPCNASVVQETNSLLQNNLGIIEGKMKRLEEENEIITKQNAELKDKLREISLELEKYLISTTEADVSSDEDKNVDALRDQVCNLILELDNLKKTARKRENDLETENALIKEKLKINSLCLEEWLAMSDQVFREVENLKSKLGFTGAFINENGFGNLNMENFSKPRQFSLNLKAFLQRLTGQLIAAQNENWMHEKKMNKSNKENILLTNANKINLEKKFKANEDSEVSHFNKLIEQCQKGIVNSNDDISNDYFTIIMENASFMEEIKILKTENDILVQNEADYHEKLKQTMMALKDKNDEIESFQKAQKLLEEEKNRMMDMLMSYENQKKMADQEISEISLRMSELSEKNKVCQLELQEKSDKLKTAFETNKILEKSCQMKDDLLNKFKVENDELLKAEVVKNKQIEILNSEINNLEVQKTHLDSEISSTKILASQTQKEMAEYIKHLETVVSNNQEALEKNKEKLKNLNQIIARLKMENEALEKQYQCDLKLYNNTKEELIVCQERCANINNKYKQVEEDMEKLYEKLQNVSTAEKKALEALEVAKKECKILQTDNIALKEKMNVYSQDRDESIKDQKDLINKYAILSKELHKLQEKYRNVKTECNDRTNVIQCLEIMLKENSFEYNNKIVYLEDSISHILNKIAACKHSMREKHVNVDSEVRELREHLNIFYNERQELEKITENYCSIVKHLESKVQDREKEVDDLQMLLTQEQQKRSTANQKEICHHQEQGITEENKKESKSCLNMVNNAKLERLKNDIFLAESELNEYKKKLEQAEIKHDNEKKKLELVIADQKSEINKYQLRMEVMMRSLSNNKNLDLQNFKRRNMEEIEKKLQAAEENIEAKEQKILELNECIAQCKSNISIKENKLEMLKKKNLCMNEMLKNLQSHVSKVEMTLSNTNKCNEKQQRERNEMAEKLLQSIKIIMEEKSARQTMEILSAEKEKTYKEQMEHFKNELNIKSKKCIELTNEVENKKNLIQKLQLEIKKAKIEISSLKAQLVQKWKEKELHQPNSLSPTKTKSCLPERLESCLRELKELRDINLLLRKKEGEDQAKIVRLEDEIRDARLIIKELEGGIKIEKKSKKALRDMMISAKMEINGCLNEKQIISMVADRISRHLDFKNIE